MKHRSITPLLLACLLCVPARAQTDTAVLLDGTRVGKNIAGIADGKVTFEGDANPVDLQNLRRIERPVAKAEAEAAARVYLTGGGYLRAKSITLSETECNLEWAHGKLKLPIAAVRAVRFTNETDAKKLPAGHDVFDADVAAPPPPGGSKDKVYVNLDNKIQSFEGVFLDLSADQLKLNYDKEDRAIDRAKIFALMLAGTGRTPALTGLCNMQFIDGSSAWAKVDKLDGGAGGNLQITLAGGVAMTTPWAAVMRLDVRSDRLVFLSDIEPADVFERAIADVGRWQRDRSVRGKPLTLKGRVFEKGLGVHATSRLGYLADAKFSVFAATIGIDDSTKGKGDCEFAVIADGKELFRKRVKAGDDPTEVRVKIPEGTRKVTLAVEAGEDLDFADHGNWCDARWIRE